MRNDSEEREDRTTAWILAEASKWSLYGVEVKIDGMFYTGESSEVIDHVREDNYYMEDYVSDDTVSYTHLDVYKRQHYEKAAKQIENICLTIVEMRFLWIS